MSEENRVITARKEGRKERNYGIDLLKTFAMFLIVMDHLLAHGGMLSAAKGTTSIYLVTAVNVLCFWPVNAYALSTGVTGFHGKHDLSRLIYLYVQTIFYSAGIVILLYLSGFCSMGEVLRDLFPLIGGRYWYFTAYFFLFLLMPYLDKLIDTVDHFKLTVILSLLCLLNALSISGNIFHWNYGLSGSWLCILYLFGALLGKYRVAERVSAKVLLLVTAVCLLLSYLGYLIVPELAMRLAGIHYGEYQFLKFTAPTILLSGIAIVLLFSKIQINSRGMQKALRLLSSLTFGVFLIHEDSVFVDAVYRDKLSMYLEHGTLYAVGMLFIWSAVLFVFCLAVDFLRSRLFALLKIDRLSNRLAAWLKKTYAALSARVRA